MANEIFNNALSNFINDFSDGGAIRHLADCGYTVSEICGKLDYPMRKESVAQIVWKHYLDTGKIAFEKPDKSYEKISYVKEQDSFGRISMRRVVEQVDISDKQYVEVDFGKELYQKKPEFVMWLDGLGSKDREYIIDLPWPLTSVYHELDDRLKRMNYTKR